MRIGFDGKRAVQNFTGLGNYSRYVADILCHFYPENDYVLYAPKKRENKRMNLLTGQYRQLTLAYPATSFWKKLSSLWRVWGITSQLEKEGIELFHGLSNELPLNIHKSRIKSIVTIHTIQLQTGDFLSFADFFFDGVVADYLVQSRINETRRKVAEAIRRVEELTAKLRAKYSYFN